MRSLYILTLLLMNACVVKGTGVYTGKLVDVSWEGILYPSCEIRQQTGYVAPRDANGASMNTNEERASTNDKALCDKLKSMVGQEVTIHYESHVFQPTGLKTTYVITSVEGVSK